MEPICRCTRSLFPSPLSLGSWEATLMKEVNRSGWLNLMQSIQSSITPSTDGSIFTKTEAIQHDIFHQKMLHCTNKWTYCLTFRIQVNKRTIYQIAKLDSASLVNYDDPMNSINWNFASISYRITSNNFKEKRTITFSLSWVWLRNKTL